MTVDMTIGDKIKRVRELKNFTQKSFAEKIGMTETGYAKIERDETDIPYSRLEQIAAALNVKTEDIVCFDEKQVFNNYGKIEGNQFSTIHYAHSEKIEKLYEDKIKLLEEKIALLETINQLKK